MAKAIGKSKMNNQKNLGEKKLDRKKSSSLNQRKSRGASTRLIVLLLLLVVVAAGCIYEFSVARPTFQSAWDKIQQIDNGTMEIDGERIEPSEITSKQVQELLGQAPANVDETIHEDCVVETYRWPSGMVVKNHDIHIVYTKLKDGLVETKPELKGKYFYYSASAGQPLDLDDNFPPEKRTIVVNLNAPALAGLSGSPRPSRNNAEDDAEKKGKSEEESSGEDQNENAKEEETKGEGDDTASESKEVKEEAKTEEVKEEAANSTEEAEKSADEKKKADDKK